MNVPEITLFILAYTIIGLTFGRWMGKKSIEVWEKIGQSKFVCFLLFPISTFLNNRWSAHFRQLYFKPDKWKDDSFPLIWSAVFSEGASFDKKTAYIVWNMITWLPRCIINLIIICYLYPLVGVVGLILWAIITPPLAVWVKRSLPRSE